MKFLISTLIGILIAFLKPTYVQADAVAFSGQHCREIKARSWTSSTICKKAQYVYSFNQSKELFCSYKITPGEGKKEIAAKLRFYRNLNESRFIDFESGEARRGLSAATQHIVFSKRDILLKKRGLCSPLNSTNTKNAAYFLHLPNSFYVLKSGLKKTAFKKGEKEKESKERVENQKKARPTPEPILFAEQKQKNLADKKSTKGFSYNKTTPYKSFTVKPSLFFENLSGTQISNSSTAELSTNLSPGLNLKMTFGESKARQYGFSVDLDFHIFNERADELFISNNSVQTLAVNFFSTLKLHNKFKLVFTSSLVEDLFYERASSTNLAIEKELVPRFSILADIGLYSKKAFSIKIKPEVFYDLAAGPIQSGLGYATPLEVEFKRSHQIWSFGLNYLSITKDLIDLELERTSLSFYINTKVFF